MERKHKWVQRSPEWIKEHPKQGTMYKVNEDGEEFVTKKQQREEVVKFKPQNKDVDSGIYVIICEPTKRAYVGQSKNMPVRLRNHKMVMSGEAKGLSRTYIDMMKDWNRYGEDGFEFNICKPSIPEHLLIEEEAKTMSEYIGNGYVLYNTSIVLTSSVLHCPADLVSIIKKTIKMCQNKDFVNSLTRLLKD